jgi:hypothetical protein
MNYSLSGRPTVSLDCPRAASHGHKEENGTEHCEVSTGIADHVPEALGGAREFRKFGRGNGGDNDDQERNASGASPKSDDDQKAAGNLKRSDKVGREIRVREADASKPGNAHVWIREFENALREKNQSDSKAYKENACRSRGGLEEESR